MKQFSQSTSWTLAEDLGHLKGQERSPHNRVDERKKKGNRRGEEEGWDLLPWWANWRRGEVPASEEAPLPAGRSIGTEGELQGLSEESAAIGLWQAGQSETYTDGLCHNPACPSLRRVSTGAHGDWMLEHGVRRANLGRGLLLSVRRQPEGTEVRKSTTRNACGGNPDHHRSEVPLLSDTQGVGLPLQPLSPHTGPWPPDNRKGHHWGQLSHVQGQAIGRPPQSQFSCTRGCWLPHARCPHWGSCNPGCHCLWVPSSMEWTCVLQGSLRSKPLWVDHTQRCGLNHTWAPGAMQLRKKGWYLSSQLHKPQIDTPATGFVNSVPTEHLNRQQVLPQPRQVWL